MDGTPEIGESTDELPREDSRGEEKDGQHGSQSEIPVVSLCPPDSRAETQLTTSQSDGNLCDSCSSLGRPSSSFQLYHQVPRCFQSGAYDSPESQRCAPCSQHSPARALSCHTCQSNVTGRHAGGNVKLKVGHSCGSTHQTSCRGAVRCHWLHGSNESEAQKPRQHHVVTLRYSGLDSIVKNYSRAVAEYPLTILLGCGILLLGCSLAGLLIGPLPDFSDPLLGFEPRGTFIGVRLSSFSKLQENTGPGKVMTTSSQHSSGRLEDVNHRGSNRSQDAFQGRSKRMLATDSFPNTFLCDAPKERLARLVFRSENSASLWSLEAIHAMCEVEQSRIRSQAKFEDLCQQHERAEAEGRSRKSCCPSWSLGNYLAVLSNASCCLSLTAQQVSESLRLLRKCAPHYHEGHLVEACVEKPRRGSCSSVPPRCKQSNTVFQILHFLLDKDFLSPQTVEYQIPTLRYSLMLLPLDKGEHMMDVYMKSLEGKDLTYNNTTITAMDFGIKKALFKYYLARDTVYLVLAVLCLVFTMVLYLNSLFLVALSVLAITGSLFTSYFLYKVVCRLTFFPLVNLSAAIILLGSCANQVFIFNDCWNLHLLQNPSASAAKRVARTLIEAGYLILASGLTSSATFFSGCLCSITAIRCFSVFLGSASLLSCVLALVWLPCSSVLRERSREAARQEGKPCCSTNVMGGWGMSSRKKHLLNVARKLREMKRGFADTSNLLFLKILPCGVVKFRYIWVCWFAVLAAGGTYMSCVDPRMELSSLDSSVAQLFRSNHPFERYDAEYSHMFMFERQKHGEDKPMTITLVWGVKPVDNGDPFDPKSRGSLVLDSDFNMSQPDAQVWLRDLCKRVQNQSFYSPSPAEDKGKTTENICLVDQLLHWVSTRRCSATNDPICCDDPSFPFPPSMFERCLNMMLAEKNTGGRPAPGGQYFQSDGRTVALVLTFKTKHLFSFNFSKTDVFYQEVLSWFDKEMSGAPHGLKRGWFICPLSLYDLQRSLNSDTLLVAGVSVALAFVLLFLTTWSFTLSLYATAAVAGTVHVTTGLLILLEWKLGGIEALFISAAAGLSVHFITNYCIAYTLAPHSDKIGKVAHATKRMGCPVATLSGAFFLTGIILLPATALHFRKLGIFLFLVKCLACGFSTFFFQSLCCFFGPKKNCDAIALPCFLKKTDGGMTSLSEPGTSSSSAARAAFGKLKVGKSFDREPSGYLFPGQLCQQKHKQSGGRSGTNRATEQYELQPLAYRLSDSFENSTCTSKLSNRPSVLSDEIDYCAGELAKGGADKMDENSYSHQICQTSSPYRESALCPLSQNTTSDKLLCEMCRGGSGVPKQWTDTAHSSSSSLISQTLEATCRPSSCQDANVTESRLHLQGLLSFYSQSSCEGLEDSCETCLSDIEAGPSHVQETEDGGEDESQPGHLNGKRNTLHLSLKDSLHEACGKGTSEDVVVLPNSKPDLPDVWIKRDRQQEATC